ncbi:hypothetical protein D3C73_929980 [compost metagenome]
MHHGLGNVRQVLRVVHANAHLGDARQLAQQGQLGRPDHFVADVDVMDAGGHEGQGFADFLAADATRAQGQLAQGNLGAFVRLGVRAQRDVVAVGPGLHGTQVGLERRQVQHQAGGVDAGQGIAGLRGRGQRYAAYDFLGHRGNSVIYSAWDVTAGQDAITKARPSITKGFIDPQVNDSSVTIGYACPACQNFNMKTAPKGRPIFAPWRRFS